MIKSDNPDLLVNIFTKERERIDVNQYNAGWGYGWGTDGTLTYGRSQLRSTTEGTLYIDLIDAKKKRTSVGRSRCRVSNSNQTKKLINEFVAKILAQFPPKSK
jgi:hypothetical protein